MNIPQSSQFNKIKTNQFRRRPLLKRGPINPPIYFGMTWETFNKRIERDDAYQENPHVYKEKSYQTLHEIYKDPVELKQFYQFYEKKIQKSIQDMETSMSGGFIEEPNFPLSQRIQNGFRAVKEIVKSGINGLYFPILVITVPIGLFFPPILVIPVLEVCWLVANFTRCILNPSKSDIAR